MQGRKTQKISGGLDPLIPAASRTVPFSSSLNSKALLHASLPKLPGNALLPVTLGWKPVSLQFLKKHAVGLGLAGKFAVLGDGRQNWREQDTPAYYY